MNHNKFIEPTFENPISVLHADTREAIKDIPDSTFQCAITSPPYWGVRDYGFDEQIGSEPILQDYINTLVTIFAELRRTLRDDGTFWLNVGNTYTSGGRKWRQEDEKNKGRAMSFRPPTPEGLKKKDLIGVAWLLALALQKDGWYLRNDIIWYKPNCQPESVKDRFTVAHEYLFLFSKSEQYYFDQDAIKEQTTDGNGLKNRRTVWSLNTEPCPEAHFAVFPKKLVRPCMLAGTKINDLVLDPFYGSGTVGIVARELERRCVGIELKKDYIEISKRRSSVIQGSLIHLAS
jgi:site-specific DNA-methyltransferase (cytosine-N4-specific)